jgi:hypothetical protein
MAFNNSDLASSISKSIVYDSVYVPGRGVYLNSGIQNCGWDRVEACAQAALPSVDYAIKYLREGWPDLWISPTRGGDSDDRYSDYQSPERNATDSNCSTSLRENRVMIRQAVSLGSPKRTLPFTWNFAARSAQ